MQICNLNKVMINSKQKERKKARIKIPTKNAQKKKLQIAKTVWYKIANSIHNAQKQHEYMQMFHKIHNIENKG
jgi:hypothetical protein